MAIDPICGMTVNDKNGLHIEQEGKKVFFCSRHCLEKYQKENQPDSVVPGVCCDVSPIPFYRNKTFIITGILFLLCALSAVVPFLVPFKNLVIHYLSKTWWAILLGLFLGGMMERYIPREYISSALSRPHRRTILRSVILGFFMSTCCHGILALAIQLHKKGASNPAVIAFLLSSPWANMTFTIMLFGFFGWKALYVVSCAIVIAVNTGLIFQFLEKKGLIETNVNTVVTDQNFAILQDARRRFQGLSWTPVKIKNDLKGIIKGSTALADMVLWWLLIGIGLAAFLGAYVPPHIFHNYFGPTVTGLFFTLLAATVIEVCSEGSTPVAFEIFKQTGAFGNAFVFLMAGVATDYTEIGLLWSNVGRRVALWLPLVTVPQIIVLGLIANYLF